MYYDMLRKILGKRVYQYLATLSASLCILSSEMHFGWTSPSIPHLTKGTYRIQMTGEDASWLAVTLLLGTIVGATIAGCLTNMIGRKKVILLTALPLLTGWLMIGLATSARQLFVARFIAGISSGLAFTAVPMYLGEIAEPQVRGLLASLCPVYVVLGVLLINILGNYLPIDTTAFIASIFPVVLLATFVWMPESPTYLLQKGRNKEARATLESLRGKTEADKELKRLEGALESQLEGATIFRLFCNKVNRKAMFIAYGLRSIQQFCGTTTLTFYCKTIFEEAEDIVSPNVSTIIYFSLQLAVSFFASCIVDKLGRRPLLIVSMLGTTATLFLLSGYLFLKDLVYIHDCLKIIPFLTLYLNVICMSIGIRNVPLLMMGELFSASIKPVAVGVGTVYYSLAAIVSAKLYFYTKENFGMYMPFLIYGMLTCGSIFLVLIGVPETKGLNLEEIQSKLRGKRKVQRKIVVSVIISK